MCILLNNYNLFTEWVYIYLNFVYQILIDNLVILNTVQSR